MLQRQGLFLIVGQRRRRSIILIVAASATLAGLTLELGGAAPWVAAATALGMLVIVLGQRMSWALAVALATAAMLSAYAVMLRLAVYIPSALAYQIAAALFVVSAVAWVLLARTRKRLVLPDWHAIVPLAPVALGVGAMAVAAAVTQGTRLSWAMHSDAVWNMMVARFVLDDHGVSPGYASAAPLTPALIAAAIAPGRRALDPASLLQHDATRAAELWLLLMLCSSILAGVVALTALSRVRPVLRGLGALAVALVPLTWFGAGYAVEFGFYNATIALVVLLCSWIAWTAAATSRLAAVVTLALSLVAMLAIWAPLAVIPAGLVAVATLGGGLGWLRGLRGRRLAVFLLALGAVAGYAAAFTLPDLLREGGSLAADGGIFALGPRQVAGTTLVAVAATALVGLLLRRWRSFVGAAVVIVSAGLALGYLVAQRRGLALVWGYYPAKFGWLVCLLLIVIIGASVLSLLEWAKRRRTIAAVLIAAVGLTVGLMAYPPPTPASLDSAWPTLNTAAGGPGEVTTLLFSISDPREKNLVSSSLDDRFINGWLLQQQASGPNDPIRGFAYTLDATDVSQLCEVADVWGPGVVVHTPVQTLPTDLSTACPRAGITAVVDPALSTLGG